MLLFTVNLCSVLKNQDFVLENLFEKPATTLFTELLALSLYSYKLHH